MNTLNGICHVNYNLSNGTKLSAVINYIATDARTELPFNPWDWLISCRKLPVKNPLLACNSSPVIPSALLEDVLYKCKQFLNVPQVFFPLKIWITAFVVAAVFSLSIICWPSLVLTFMIIKLQSCQQRSRSQLCGGFTTFSLLKLEIFIVQFLTLQSPVIERM